MKNKNPASTLWILVILFEEDLIVISILKDILCQT
jgi:hypothetical protein